MPVLTEQQLRRKDLNAKAFEGQGVKWKDVQTQAEAFAAASHCKGFAVDKVPPMVQEFSASHPVRVFNVGPWRQVIMQGTLGTYIIPACPDGKPWVEMTIYDPETGKHIPALGALTFEWLRGDGQMPVRQHESKDIAEAILGIGPFQNPANSLLRFGCFISACGPDENPTAQELATANKLLREYLGALVKDARKAEQDGKVSETVGEDHYRAARILNLNPATEGWMKTQTVENNEVCPGCGVGFKKGIAFCPTLNCGKVLDMEKAKQIIKERKELGLS